MYIYLYIYKYMYIYIYTYVYACIYITFAVEGWRCPTIGGQHTHVPHQPL